MGRDFGAKTLAKGWPCSEEVEKGGHTLFAKPQRENPKIKEKIGNGYIGGSYYWRSRILD